MKLLRICLLTLLTVLLPVRGVVAATMLCGPAGAGSHTELRTAQHHQGDGQQHAHEASNPDKCNMCSASCSSPPLPSAAAVIHEPQVLTAVSFPDLSAPAPTFQSEGQERPPRTI